MLALTWAASLAEHNKRIIDASKGILGCVDATVSFRGGSVVEIGTRWRSWN